MAEIFLLAGPTASGQSAAALALAERLNAVILNADALQVYADLRVLSARPDAQDMSRAPHHLFGHVDAAEAYSVGRWLNEATAVLQACAARGEPAVMVGGTGLYFEALTRGLAEIPAISDDTRAAIAVHSAALQAESAEALHAEAMRVDPDAAASVAPADHIRLERILAVFHETGRPLSAWRAQTEPAVPREAWRGLVLAPPREALYAAIDARAEAMMAAGALEEVGALTARGLPDAAPALKALGVAPLRALLDGRCSREEALAVLQRDTRRYAKRQMTWLRGRMGDWRWVETSAQAGALESWRQALSEGST